MVYFKLFKPNKISQTKKLIGQRTYLRSDEVLPIRDPDGDEVPWGPLPVQGLGHRQEARVGGEGKLVRRVSIW